MNLPKLKQDFYKRFQQSNNFLHFTSTGLLCTLLGHSDIENAPSMTCSLSMGTQMFTRRLGGNCINIQNVRKSEALLYRFGTPTKLLPLDKRKTADILQKFSDYGISGAQILYERTIPDFIEDDTAFSVCLVRSLLKIAEKDEDILKISTLSLLGNDLNTLLACACAKKGYCTLISKGEPRYLPLPLSGYKIISAHCKAKKKDRSLSVKNAFTHISRLYPHISSITDITPEMFVFAKNDIKDKTALRYMYHLINENARINTVSNSLKRCDIKSLFHEMNISQRSIERFWDLSQDEIYLAHCSKNIQGVKAVRSWKNGIIAVTENEYIDHAIEMIKDSFESNMGYQPSFCVSDVF